MKKIVWWVQQLNRIGGTEMVSIDLANRLADQYEITLLSTVKIENEPPYQINPKINIKSLGIPTRCERFDYLTRKYLKHFRIFSLLGLLFQVAFLYAIRKPHYRRVVYKLINEKDTTLICSSIDTYMFAPKKGRVFFHYHFDANSFFGRDKSYINWSRKPDKYIFVSESTLKDVIAKKPDIKDKAVFIYNPIRFKRELNLDYKYNTIMFAGRYANQKNPIFAMKIAKELKNRGFDFKLKMFGDGPLKADVYKYLKQNNLEDVVEVNDFAKNIHDELLASDLLLLTSRYEGFGLVRGEANALSRPWLSTNWGPAVKEMYFEGRNGIILDSEDANDFADAIIKLFSNKETLKRFKQSSYDDSLHLYMEPIVEKWKNLIEGK